MQNNYSDNILFLDNLLLKVNQELNNNMKPTYSEHNSGFSTEQERKLLNLLFDSTEAGTPFWQIEDLTEDEKEFILGASIRYGYHTMIISYLFTDVDLLGEEERDKLIYKMSSLVSFIVSIFVVINVWILCSPFTFLIVSILGGWQAIGSVYFYMKFKKQHKEIRKAKIKVEDRIFQHINGMKQLYGGFYEYNKMKKQM